MLATEERYRSARRERLTQKYGEWLYGIHCEIDFWDRVSTTSGGIFYSRENAQKFIDSEYIKNHPNIKPDKIKIIRIPFPEDWDEKEDTQNIYTSNVKTQSFNPQRWRGMY